MDRPLAHPDLPLEGDRDASSRRAFEHSLQPMLVCGEDRRFRDANAAACLLMRLAPAIIRGYRLDDLIPPEMRPALASRWLARPPERDAAPLAFTCGLVMPDGGRVAASILVVHRAPERHLVAIDFAPGDAHTRRVDRFEQATAGRLTKREREVLGLVAAGRTGAQIAAQLFLAPTTVQTHVTNALIKLGAKNRANGVAIAVETGQIDLDAEGRT